MFCISANSLPLFRALCPLSLPSPYIPIIPYFLWFVNRFFEIFFGFHSAQSLNFHTHGIWFIFITRTTERPCEAVSLSVWSYSVILRPLTASPHLTYLLYHRDSQMSIVLGQKSCTNFKVFSFDFLCKVYKSRIRAPAGLTCRCPLTRSDGKKKSLSAGS